MMSLRISMFDLESNTIPTNQPEDNCNHGYNQKDVNKSTHRKGCEQAKQPQNDQQSDKSFEHDVESG